VIPKIVSYIRREIKPDSAPTQIRTLVDQCLNSLISPVDVSEQLDICLRKVTDRLISIRDQCLDDRTDCWFEFNSSSPDWIQGPYYSEPKEDFRVREAKSLRVRSADIQELLESVSFGDFEKICAAVLVLIGAKNAKRTVHSRDQGIDFHGEIILGDLEVLSLPFFRFSDMFKFWIIGQAKHYPGSKVSTPEVRNLVGSVGLARVKEFGSTSDLMNDLVLRSCDPVFVVFMTTGSFTRDAQQLARNSGVILRDILDLSKVIADNASDVFPSAEYSRRSLISWADRVCSLDPGEADERVISTEGKAASC
jgi:hypothetical protein